MECWCNLAVKSACRKLDAAVPTYVPNEEHVLGGRLVFVNAPVAIQIRLTHYLFCLTRSLAGVLFLACLRPCLLTAVPVDSEGRIHHDRLRRDVPPALPGQG